MYLSKLQGIGENTLRGNGKGGSVRDPKGGNDGKMVGKLKLPMGEQGTGGGEREGTFT